MRGPPRLRRGGDAGGITPLLGTPACQSAVLMLGTLWSLVILRRLLGRQQELVLASGLALSTAILGRWLIAA